MERLIKKIILILWLLFSLFFLFITIVLAIEIGNEFLNHVYNLKKIGNFILLFELGLLGLKAILEGGHFPLRYLIIFLITAIIMYIAVNKTSISEFKILVIFVGIISMSLLYLHISSKNKKENLKD